MYNSWNTKNLFWSGDLTEKLRELSVQLSAEVNRLTVDDLADGRRMDSIAQLTAKHQLIPITMHVEAKKISRRETTVTRNGYFGDERAKVAGLEITVSIPFDGAAQLWWLRPSSYRISGTPIASVQNRTLTIGHDFTGVPKPEEVRSWYQGEIANIRWYLDKIAEQVNEHNAGIESTLPGLVEQRAAKLDALRKFDADLDLDLDEGTG